MANVIKIKRSSITGNAPSSTDLEVGELAVNTADALLFTKHTDGSIVEIAGSGASVSVINNLTSTSTTSVLSANQGRILKEKINELIDFLEYTSPSYVSSDYLADVDKL